MIGNKEDFYEDLVNVLVEVSTNPEKFPTTEDKKAYVQKKVEDMLKENEVNTGLGEILECPYEKNLVFCAAHVGYEVFNIILAKGLMKLF